MKRALLMATLMMAVALAGCSGEEKPEAETPTGTPGGEIDPGALAEGKGALQGIVIDDAYRPIADALVLVQPLGLTTRTTINGEFAFLDVEPGSYTLRAEADGHEAQGQTVTIDEGLITEANVLARRIVSEGGSTITQEHSAFIPCSFIVAGAGGNYGCLDTSADSYRPGPSGVNFTGEETATYLVAEMKVRREGHFSLEVREDGWEPGIGYHYGTANTDGGDYAKLVLQKGNATDGDVWNNDLLLEVIAFYTGEGLVDPVAAGPATLYPGSTGVSFADQAQIVLTLFLGEPDTDPFEYCVLCEG